MATAHTVIRYKDCDYALNAPCFMRLKANNMHKQHKVSLQKMLKCC